MQRVGWAIVGMLSVSLGVAAYALFESDNGADSYSRAERVLAECRDAFPDRDCTGGELPNGQFAWVAAPSSRAAGFQRVDPARMPTPPAIAPTAPETPATPAK